MNHFSIMLQRRLREQERGEDEEDETEKSGKKKKKGGGGRGGDLRIHDLEDDLEMSSDDSDSSMGEGKGAETATDRRQPPDSALLYPVVHVHIFSNFIM